jgi:hypothetical protein
MKKILFIFASAVFMAACNSADKTVDKSTKDSLDSHAGHDHNGQTDTQASADPATLTSIQWLDSTNMNIGKVKKGAEVEVTFRFRNIGDKPLIISAVNASCGCTVAEKPEEPVAAGATDIIKAKFDSKNQTIGEHTKSVTVTANTQPQAVHILNFRVEVIE